MKTSYEITTTGAQGRSAPFIDSEALARELDDARKATLADPDASKPMKLSVGGLKGMVALVTTNIHHLARNCRKNHDDLEARIGELEAEVKALKETVSLTVEAACAKWTIDFERRAYDTWMREIDRLPKPKDGKDGLSVDDFDIGLDGHTLTLSLKSGERTITRKLHVPFPLYRGTYKYKSAYEPGDAMTYGGNLWICLKSTIKAPPSDCWQLAIRKGKDGKDLRQEEQ